MLENNALGSAASSGFDILQGEASKLGVDIEKAEFVNVLVNLTGSISDPKVKVNLLGTDGDISTSLADAAKDAAKKEFEAQKEFLKD